MLGKIYRTKIKRFNVSFVKTVSRSNKLHKKIHGKCEEKKNAVQRVEIKNELILNKMVKLIIELQNI